MKPKTFLSKIVFIALAIVELILVLRFIVRLLGAKSSGIFEIIYDLSKPLIEPFLSVLTPITLGDRNQFVIETSTLFAMLAYLIISYIIIKVIDTVASTSSK